MTLSLILIHWKVSTVIDMNSLYIYSELAATVLLAGICEKLENFKWEISFCVRRFKWNEIHRYFHTICSVGPRPSIVRLQHFLWWNKIFSAKSFSHPLLLYPLDPNDVLLFAYNISRRAAAKRPPHKTPLFHSFPGLGVKNSPLLFPHSFVFRHESFA